MTISHLILEYNKYNTERNNILTHFQNISIPLNMKNLLADNEEIIQLLLEFLSSTDLKTQF